MSEANGTSPGIYRKIAEVLDAIENIPKTGKNPHFGYAFHKEQVVVEHLRPLLAEKGVVLVVRQGERSIEKTDNGGKVVVAPTDVTFVDADDGSSFTARAWGEGQDTQDKGSHKALVGAFKYALMKTFLISAGDDDIEGEKRQRGNGQKRRRRSAKGQDANYHCPECGGPMWDNRRAKESGEVKSTYPDFKCQDKQCDEAIWGSHPDEAPAEEAPAEEASDALIDKAQGLLDMATDQELIFGEEVERVEAALESKDKERVQNAHTWLQKQIRAAAQVQADEAEAEGAPA